MAINAYCGLQGSGKSYEVTSSVIVPAIDAGRRVVTNIDGIDEAAIHAYIESSIRKEQGGLLGTIVRVDNERIGQPHFFPRESDTTSPSVVQPGDLVVVDEAWRYWPSDGGKLAPEHMQFFRMHRHFTHPETGVACDVALVIQDISGLHRSVRNVVECSFRTTKLKSLGLSTSYRLEIFEGYRQTRKSRTDLYVKRYRKEIFALYRSYSNTNGRESAIDGRQNILRNPSLWFWSALFIVCVIGGSLLIWKFFHPRTATTPAAPAADASRRSSERKPPTRESVNSASAKAPISTAWRIVGTLADPEGNLVILRGSNGGIRVERFEKFSGTGLALSGKVDGAVVSKYSGVEAR